MTTHTDENPSTSQENPNFSDTVATPSGDIIIEEVEGDFDFLGYAENREDEESEVVKKDEETELIIKEELEDTVYTDAEEIVTNEAEN